MKRRFKLCRIIVLLFLLGSCAKPDGTDNTEAKPIEARAGNVCSFVSPYDYLALLGYPLSTQEVTRPEIYSPYWRYDRDAAGEKTIEFNGESFVAYYVNSRRLTYRKTCYDQCETVDQKEFNYKFFLDRETDRIIGYEKNYTGADPGYDTPMSDEELTAKAVEALSEFTDVDYYKEKRVEDDSKSSKRIVVRFYNKAGAVEFADSSWVKLTKGGVVVQVMALPEPDTINACHFNELNVDEFDAKAEEQIKKEFKDYHIEDETKLLDVRYTGMKVKYRYITSDDDGKPVIAYYVTPQLEYDLTWKDETAKNMIDIGREVPEKGIDEPQVQLIVYIE